MVHFVGAGSGAPDLITLRGKKLIEEADVIIYAGSLVNPELLCWAREECKIFNSAKMTLGEVIEEIKKAEADSLMTVRLHTGDPSIYGSVREQMDELDKLDIEYDVCPGVSSFCGAAAALNLEYTLPGISQTVIITRQEGRTPVPEGQRLRALSQHRATMVLFLSAGMAQQVSEELMAGGYDRHTPVAVVYKATWPDERKFYTTLEKLAVAMEAEGISKTALIIVGDVVLAEENDYLKSKLYDESFSTEYRAAKSFRG